MCAGLPAAVLECAKAEQVEGCESERGCDLCDGLDGALGETFGSATAIALAECLGVAAQRNLVALREGQIVNVLPDGTAPEWMLQYEGDFGREHHTLRVSAETVTYSFRLPSEGPEPCVGAITPLDSEQAVPQLVSALAMRGVKPPAWSGEPLGGPPTTHAIRFDQGLSPCLQGWQPRPQVMVLEFETERSWFGHFDGEGQLDGVYGPCALGEVEECLTSMDVGEAP